MTVFLHKKKKKKSLSVQDVEFIKLCFVCAYVCMHSIKCGRTQNHKYCYYFTIIISKQNLT